MGIISRFLAGNEGEYAMVKATAEYAWIDGARVSPVFIEGGPHRHQPGQGRLDSQQPRPGRSPAGLRRKDHRGERLSHNFANVKLLTSRYTTPVG